MKFNDYYQFARGYAVGMEHSTSLKTANPTGIGPDEMGSGVFANTYARLATDFKPEDGVSVPPIGEAYANWQVTGGNSLTSPSPLVESKPEPNTPRVTQIVDGAHDKWLSSGRENGEGYDLFKCTSGAARDLTEADIDYLYGTYHKTLSVEAMGDGGIILVTTPLYDGDHDPWEFTGEVEGISPLYKMNGEGESRSISYIRNLYGIREDA